MNHISVVVGSALAALFSQAVAQDQEQCKSKISPSSAFLSRINTAVLLMRQGGQTSEADTQKFRALSEEAAGTRWTCSDAKVQKHCCEGIPIKILVNPSSATQCKYGVTFPYGELALTRKDHGGKDHKPKITWQLVDTTGQAPQLAFGTLGIETTSILFHRVPVDDCKPHGSGKTEFSCQGNGKGKILFWDARADHRANVYLAGHVDDSNYLCANLDPLIINTD